MITESVIQVGTGCSLELAKKWLAPMQDSCSKFSIDTAKRISAFLANIGVESFSLSKLEENLNYSAEGLVNTWPSRFANSDHTPNELAKSIARKPELIANQVYANRYGNGDIESGDGWKYRGRGLIQITFKDNYSTLGAALGLDLLENPDQLLEIESASDSAAWFFSKGHPECLTASDAGNFNRVVELINGRPPSAFNQGPLRIFRYNSVLNLLIGDL